MGRRRGCKCLTDYEKGRIMGSLEAGLSKKETARRMGLTSQAVLQVQRRCQAGSVGCKRSSGRPRKLSAKTGRVLRRLVKKDRWASSVALAAELTSAYHTPVSRWTVQRNLHDQGFRPTVPRLKPKLTKLDKQRRVEWAREHAQAPAHWWDGVFFTDEKVFRSTGHRRKKIWMDDVDRKDQNLRIERQKFEPSVMVWAGFVAGHALPLQVIDGVINAVTYRDSILNNVVLPTWRALANARASRHRLTHLAYLHDRATVHTAACVTEWMAQHHMDPLLLPANSPDCNPMENLWSITLQKMKAEEPATRGELIAAVKKAWTIAATRTTCTNLAHSLPKRLKEVIRRRGDYTQ